MQAAGMAAARIMHSACSMHSACIKQTVRFDVQRPATSDINDTHLTRHSKQSESPNNSIYIISVAVLEILICLNGD